MTVGPGGPVQPSGAVWTAGAADGRVALALVRWDGLAHRWPGAGWVDPDATARLLTSRVLTSRPAWARCPGGRCAASWRAEMA
jgi:hypothetical protein